MSLLLKPLKGQHDFKMTTGSLHLFCFVSYNNPICQPSSPTNCNRFGVHRCLVYWEELPEKARMSSRKGMENCRTIGWSFSNRKDQMSCQKTKSVIDTKTNVHYRIYRSHISKLSIKWNPSWFFRHDNCGIPLVISLVRQYCKSSSMAVCGKEKRSCIGRFPTKCWDSHIFTSSISPKTKVNGCHPIHCG